MPAAFFAKALAGQGKEAAGAAHARRVPEPVSADRRASSACMPDSEFILVPSSFMVECIAQALWTDE